jgi:hypothetical protein
VSGEPHDPVGLDDIKPPTPEPAVVPDQHTRKALKEHVPSPTHRLEAMTKLHIEDVTRERDDYKRKYFEVHERLGAVQPEATRLRELLSASISWSLMSTIATIIGGCMISSAGYFPSRHGLLLWGGWAVLVTGLIAVAWNHLHVYFRRDAR